jgi:hypothetical protein
MNAIKEIVAANLDRLRKERAKNRVLRAKFPDKDDRDEVHRVLEMELKNCLESPLPKRPVVVDPIIPVDYPPVPRPPAIERDCDGLGALALMYPIGQRDDKTWYIVSPVLYMEQVCEYKKEWENHQVRIRAVLFHAAKLMSMLSLVLRRPLTYPIRIEGPKAYITRNDQEYNVIWYESLRDFFIALSLLNYDAVQLRNNGAEGTKGKSNLLENLHEVLRPYTQRTQITVDSALFRSVEAIADSP